MVKKQIKRIGNEGFSNYVASLSDEEKAALARFAIVVNSEDMRVNTTPSAIAVGGPEEIGIERISLRDVEKYLIVHPVVPRGIEIKANRMIGRNYKVSSVDESKEANDAAYEMSRLLEASGGSYKIKKWIQDTYGFGNGYLTLVPNTSSKRIIKLNIEHPIYFRISRYKPGTPAGDDKKYPLVKSDFATEFSGPLKIDPATKCPISFTQVEWSDAKGGFVPIGDEIPANRVAHLTFDTWGDEVEGISLIQYVHRTINYMLNIDEAAAESTFRNGFTQKVFSTESLTEQEMKSIAKGLKNVNAKDAIILPKGVDAKNLLPGTTQYAEIFDKFLTLISIRLGIPKPLLTLDGTSTNKATLGEQTDDMISDFAADELRVRQVIEEQVFVPACQLLYGKDFDKFPIFQFNPYTASKEKKASIAEVIAKTATSMTDVYSRLLSLGQEEAANKVLAFMIENIIVEDSNLTPLTDKEIMKASYVNNEAIEVAQPKASEQVSAPTMSVEDSNGGAKSAPEPTMKPVATEDTDVAQ